MATEQTIGSVGGKDDLPPPVPTSEPPDDSVFTNVDECAEGTSCPFEADSHVGKPTTNVLLDMSPEKTYNLLFMNSIFLDKILAAQKCYDVVYGQWQDDLSTGNKTRQVTFTVTLPSTILGPSTSSITEVQVLSNVTKANELYIVDMDSTNAGIPYADNFKITTHYCLAKEIVGGQIKTRFKTYADIKFLKSTMFMIKNMIEKNAIVGCENMAADVQAALVAESKGQVVSTKRRKIHKETARRSQTTRVTGNSQRKTGWLVSLWVVFLVLVLAGLINTYLYARLTKLENQKYLHMMSSGHVLRQPRNQNEQIIEELFKAEDEYYDGKFLKWKTQIEEMIEALNQIETTFKEIKESVVDVHNRERSWTKLSRQHPIAVPMGPV